ncbi:MAG: hypothetical protein CMF95_02065 [Candidatus Marinimicrobia bacterium]|nr:hypothetical protein [Candidatus Neomarinimicrobiota bacterium]
MVMRKVKNFMLEHPILSILIIFPFSLSISISLFDIILNFILPLIFGFWGSGWIYKTIIGTSWSKGINKPFWFI